MSSRLVCGGVAAALAVATPAAARSWVGLQLDGGAPDGLGASLVVRPFSFLRLDAGATTDLAAPGIRGGFVLSVPWYLSPAIAVHAGRQLPGDLNAVVQRFVPAASDSELLRRFSYEYVDLHAGIEVGHPDWVMLTIHAGYSWFVTRTSGLPQFVSSQDPSLSVRGEATLHIWAPSAKVGLVFYVH